jgi:ABC-type phosphate transport system substrate-binding protein
MKKSILLICLTCILASFKIYTGAASGSDLVIIVNKENTVGALSASEVKLYWMRKIKKRWPDINKNIRPADYKSKNAAQTAFYAKVLGLTATDVETYFTQKQYDSAEKPQDKFSSENELINFVASEIGAIGFVSAGSLSESDKERVKVVCTVN